MKQFKNISIKNRLLIVMTACVFIFISFGSFTVLELQSLGKVTKSLYNQPLQVSNAAIEARVDIIKIHKSLKDVILLEDENSIAIQLDDVEAMENRVISNLDIIRKNMAGSNESAIEKEIRTIFLQWKDGRDELIKAVNEGRIKDAINISNGKNADYVRKLEEKLTEMDNYSSNKANELLKQANDIERSQRITLVSLIVFLGLVVSSLFIIGIKSVLRPILSLQETMSKSFATGELKESDINEDNEIGDMARHYNILVRQLMEQFWSKDNENKLADELRGNLSIQDLTQKTINFLSRLLEAGSAVFYIYDEESSRLNLSACYAFTEMDRLLNSCCIGEGVIGQVALEKKPILLKNIKRGQALITTGTINETPLNVYAFPIIYEERLYGVIELSSFEPFTELKQQFIRDINKIVATNLYSSIQNEKIRALLKISERAKTDAQTMSEELKKTNEALEEQQRLLQQHAEELQQSNSQLEEQQQMLHQQSEELQQTNIQLEEQQQQMEEQARLLNIQNQELEKSREEIMKRAEELEKVNSYKSEFLANMSHELRTPLNSIILLSKLLLKKDSGLVEANYEKIDIINKSGQELLRLINDVLDLSKIEAGKMDVNVALFHSEELVKSIKEWFSEVAKEKNLAFIIDDMVKSEIYGDQDRICQVLRNLLSNAFKFTKSGSVSLKMLSEEDNYGGVKFIVEDTGIGISKEKINIIFEEFKQADGSISRKYGGTGLGLSISKKLCELMGGDITVESEVSKGTKFTFYLPNMLKEALTMEAAVTVENEEEIVKEESKEREAAEKDKKTILIIEDDMAFADHIRRKNEQLGFNTLIAMRGKEGLELAKKHKIDGILLDLGLPDVKGEELLKELKFVNQYSGHVPHIIIYTARDMTKDQEKEIRNYADSIIIKSPYSDKRLMDEIVLFLCKVKRSNKEERNNTNRTDRNYALSLKGKTILIVDDDARNLFVLASSLEEYEANIIEADNGEDALQKLEKNNVDLILMDIMMPVMDGYKAMRKIRERPHLKHIPIIALTAKFLKGDREKCIEAGANDYISKPVDYDTLIRLVKAWINKD